MCRVAAERGIFCRGFGRWPEREFHERWKRLLGVSTHLNRSQIERLADIWQLSEQLRHRVPLACDAQTLSPGACRGWDEFSNADLSRFCKEIMGRNVTVADGPQDPCFEAAARDTFRSVNLPQLRRTQ